MSKHTPGPWTAIHNDHYWAVFVPWQKEEEPDIFCQYVASVTDTPKNDTPEWAGVFDGEANAHLIAAAPELLEALETITREWAKDVPDGETDKYGSVIDPCFKKLWDDAKAAISKAKGETDA